MKEEWKWIQIIFTGVGALLGFLFDEFDGFILALIALIVIDYITGIMRAIVEKKLSSEIGFKGIFRKVLIFAMITVSHLFDNVLLKDGNVLRNGIIFFYLSNEGLSILENACFLGLPIPKKFKDVLIQLKEDDENKNK